MDEKSIAPVPVTVLNALRIFKAHSDRLLDPSSTLRTIISHTRLRHGLSDILGWRVSLSKKANSFDQNCIPMSLLGSEPCTIVRSYWLHRIRSDWSKLQVEAQQAMLQEGGYAGFRSDPPHFSSSVLFWAILFGHFSFASVHLSKHETLTIQMIQSLIFGFWWERLYCPFV